MVLTSVIEGLHNAQLRWELRKSKPASPDAARALAVELNYFTERDSSLKGGPQATVVSTAPPQSFMGSASSSQEDMTGTLIQTIRQEIQKNYLRQVETLRICVIVVLAGNWFVLTVQDQTDKVQLKNNVKITENKKIRRTIATDTIKIKTKDTTTVAISKTTVQKQRQHTKSATRQ